MLAKFSESDHKFLIDQGMLQQEKLTLEALLIVLLMVICFFLSCFSILDLIHLGYFPAGNPQASSEKKSYVSAELKFFALLSLLKSSS